MCPHNAFTPQLSAPVATMSFVFYGFVRANSCPPEPFTPHFFCKPGSEAPGTLNREVATGQHYRTF